MNALCSSVLIRFRIKEYHDRKQRKKHESEKLKYVEETTELEQETPWNCDIFRTVLQHTIGNKPGTAKVGAISKAQNCKRGL